MASSPRVHVVSINVKEGDEIAQTDTMSKSDNYVRVIPVWLSADARAACGGQNEYFPQHVPEELCYRTRVVNNNSRPAWNQSFTKQVPVSSVADGTGPNAILVEVWDRSSLNGVWSSDTFVGANCWMLDWGSILDRSGDGEGWERLRHPHEEPSNRHVPIYNQHREWTGYVNVRIAVHLDISTTTREGTTHTHAHKGDAAAAAAAGVGDEGKQRRRYDDLTNTSFSEHPDESEDFFVREEELLSLPPADESEEAETGGDAASVVLGLLCPERDERGESLVPAEMETETDRRRSETDLCFNQQAGIVIHLCTAEERESGGENATLLGDESKDSSDCSNRGSPSREGHGERGEDGCEEARAKKKESIVHVYSVIPPPPDEVITPSSYCCNSCALQ